MFGRGLFKRHLIKACLYENKIFCHYQRTDANMEQNQVDDDQSLLMKILFRVNRSSQETNG